MGVDATGPQRRPDKTACMGRVARYALAGIRIVNGSVALIAPSVIIHRFGESPADDNAAVYGLRMFGIRTVVIGVDLLALAGAPLRRALGQAIIIHASDTVTAASLGLSGRVRRPWAIALTLISAANTGLAVTEVISAKLCGVAVLEMGEDESGAGDVADSAGAGVMCWRARHRWVSSANPRSPRQRNERWRALRVRVLMSRSRPSAGRRTGI
jgi:hypothetical protein